MKVEITPVKLDPVMLLLFTMMLLSASLLFSGIHYHDGDKGFAALGILFASSICYLGREEVVRHRD